MAGLSLFGRSPMAGVFEPDSQRHAVAAEGDLLWQGIGGKPTNGLRIVAGPQLAAGYGSQVYDQQAIVVRLAVFKLVMPGKYTEQAGRHNLEASFLLRFADGGLLGGLVPFNIAGRQGPASDVGRVLALDHQHTAVALDQASGSRGGVLIMDKTAGRAYLTETTVGLAPDQLGSAHGAEAIARHGNASPILL